MCVRVKERERERERRERDRKWVLFSTNGFTNSSEGRNREKEDKKAFSETARGWVG